MDYSTEFLEKAYIAICKHLDCNCLKISDSNHIMVCIGNNPKINCSLYERDKQYDLCHALPIVVDLCNNQPCSRNILATKSILNSLEHGKTICYLDFSHRHTLGVDVVSIEPSISIEQLIIESELN